MKKPSPTTPALADLLARTLTDATVDAIRADANRAAALTAALAVADADTATITHLLAPHTVSGNPRRAYLVTAVTVLADGSVRVATRTYTEHYRGTGTLADALRSTWTRDRAANVTWTPSLAITAATYDRLAREGDALHGALAVATPAERDAAALALRIGRGQ